jgi:hypothetical protein
MILKRMRVVPPSERLMERTMLVERKREQVNAEDPQKGSA